MQLELDNVVSVYSGKSGKCCCGCSGKHSYASALKEEGAKSRGYAVQDDEVNDLRVEMIFKKISKAYWKDVEKVSDTCYSLDTGTPLYVVYLKGH